MNDIDTAKMVKEYRFTVIVFGLIIVSMFAGFMFVVLVYVPDIYAKANAEQLDPMIRAAVSDEFENYINQVNQ